MRASLQTALYTVGRPTDRIAAAEIASADRIGTRGRLPSAKLIVDRRIPPRNDGPRSTAASVHRMRTSREVAVFIIRDGRHLILRRTGQGIWHVVAGVVEDGESLEEAGIRELMEESGLVLSALPFDLGSQVHGIDEEWRSEFPPGLSEVTVHSFGVEAPSGWEPVMNEEHDAYRWCGVDEARRLLHWPEATEMVQRLAEIIDRRRPR
jgi:dihydroneopterin triphosphate diphosphatase